jgi:hypothetical protein
MKRKRKGDPEYGSYQGALRRITKLQKPSHNISLEKGFLQSFRV